MYEDTVEYLPLYSARLDGEYSRGGTNVDDMPVESGEMVAVSVTAHHPYVEWRQQCIHTMYWANAPVTFPAMRKVEVRFGVRANWSHEPISGAHIAIDMMDVPRPPPPLPIAWEWCECATSYAQRLVVCVFCLLLWNMIANHLHQYPLSTWSSHCICWTIADICFST